MLKSVKKRVEKKSIIKIVVCFTIIVGLLIFFNMEPINYLKGTQKVDINNLDVDALVGQYIETDFHAAFDTGIKEVTTTKRRNIKTSTKTTGKYYLIAYNDSNMLCFVYATNESDIEKINDLVKKSVDVDDPIGIHVKGSFVKFTNNEEDTLGSYMRESGIDEQFYPPYVFKMSHVGNVVEHNIIAIYFFIILAFIYAIISARKGFTNYYIKDLKKFAASVNYDFDRFVQELESSPCVDGVWISERFTAYLSGNKIKAFENKPMIWAYYYEYRRKSRGVTTVSNQVKLYNKEKKLVTIVVSCEEDAQQVLTRYFETQPQMVIGYKKELEELFKKSIDEFVKIPYQQDDDKTDEVVEEE